jgi:putative (di)nucleoside polyphosphate hydrolase
MLINAEGKVWLGRRADVTEGKNWQMPQGGIDKGETPKQAALRELKEEIGTNKGEIIAETSDWLTYDLPQEASGRFKGKYRGQKQMWFAIRFTGEDADINIETEHPEFNAWRWADAADVVEEVVEFKRPVYEQVMAAFAGYTSSVQ